MAPRKPSGAWTEADYAAKGLGAIRLRLPLQVLTQLQELAVARNIGRGEVVAQLIAAEHGKTKPKK